MKIYTKTGDNGTTGLLGGKRVSKSDSIIECIGQLDELNAYIGLIATFPVNAKRMDLLLDIQKELFNAGAILAKDPDKPTIKVPNLDNSLVTKLELEIDLMTEQLPPLKYFILPGGNVESAHIQIARTVCRQAERAVIGINNNVNEIHSVIIFLNQLSDYLFVVARIVLHEMDNKEIYWIPNK